MIQDQSVLTRFLEKIRHVGPACWEWTGAHTKGGYGTLNARKYYGEVIASRIAVRLAGRVIPEKMTIDHLCLNTRCVRPSHLEVVSYRTNILRGGGTASRNAQKTHCPQGHPYDAKNTIRDRKGWRKCRTCLRGKKHRRA